MGLIILIGLFGIFAFPFLLLGAVINTNKEKRRRRQNIEDMKEAYAAAIARGTTPTAEVQNIPLKALRAETTTNGPKNFAELVYGGGDDQPIESYRMYGSQR